MKTSLQSLMFDDARGPGQHAATLLLPTSAKQQVMAGKRVRSVDPILGNFPYFDVFCQQCEKWEKKSLKVKPNGTGLTFSVKKRSALLRYPKSLSFSECFSENLCVEDRWQITFLENGS